jgi:hypothetical protein
LEYWAKEVKERVTDCVWIFLIATKSDLVTEEDYQPFQTQIKDFMKVIFLNILQINPKKHSIKRVWKVSSLNDPKHKYEEIFKNVAKIIYSEVDNMNSWNSGLIVNKNSLLKNKSLVLPSNSLLNSQKSVKGKDGCNC